MTSPWLVCPRSLESFARSLRVSEAVEPSWWSQSPSSSYPPTLSSFVHSSPVGILICPLLLASGALAASSDTEIIRYQKLKLPNIKWLKRKKKRKGKKYLAKAVPGQLGPTPAVFVSSSVWPPSAEFLNWLLIGLLDHSCSVPVYTKQRKLFCSLSWLPYFIS